MAKLPEDFDITRFGRAAIPTQGTSLSSYNPSWREKLSDFVGQYFGGDSNLLRRDIAGTTGEALGYVPVVSPSLSANDAYRAAQSGQYGSAASSGAEAVLGLVPGANKLVEKGIQKIAGPIVRGAGTLADKTLGILAGEQAINAPVSELPSAKSLLKHGDDPDKVWQSTGWDFDPAGQWNWEIPDLNAKFTDLTKISADPANPSRLEDVFEHPELYESYPALKDIPIYKLTDKSPNMGVFDPTTGAIGIRVDPIGDPIFDADIDPKGSLLHEIQHAVQKMEGWESGGWQGMAKHTSLTPGTFSGELMQRVLPVYMSHYGLDPYDQNDIAHFIGTPEFMNMLDEISLEGYARLMGESQAENVVFRSKAPDLASLEKFSPTTTLGGRVPGGGSRLPEEILTRDELMRNPYWSPSDFDQFMTNLRGPVLGPAEQRRRRLGLTLTSTP